MSDRPPADWYPDPEVPGQQRYWDGQQWTEHRATLYVAGLTASRARGSGMPDIGEFLARCGRAAVGSVRPMVVPLAVVIGSMLVLLVAFLATSSLDDWFREVLEVVLETPTGADVVLPDAPPLGADLVPLLAFGVVTLLGSIYLSVAWQFPMADVLDDRPPTLPTTDAVVRGAGRLLLLLVLAGLAMVALVGVVAVAAVVTGPFVAFLIIALVPTLAWVGVRLSLVLPLVVIDGLGLGAIAASWQATRGSWWALFGRFLLFGLIFSVATQAVGVPVQIAATAAPSLTIPLAFVSMVLQIVATPISYVPAIVLHHALLPAPAAPAVAGGRP